MNVRITKNIVYGLLAIAAVAVMLFVVLPQVTDKELVLGDFNVSAATALAFGSSGGSGSGSGGDSGCCDYSPSYDSPSYDYSSYEDDEPKSKPKPARCDFLTANKTHVDAGGENVTLSWGTTRATSVSINNGVGSVPDDGSETVFVDETTTFTLTASSWYGSDTCTVKIVVEEPEEPAKCDFLTASKTKVDHGGENVTLSWGTTNADSVSINNGVGSVADDGSKTVFVDDTTTFVLTASNDEGSDTCSVKIIEEDEEEKEPRCDFFTVSDDEVEEGDKVTLSWGTTNADSVFIDNGVGYVDDDGSKRVRIDDDDDVTYTLTVRNDGKTDTCKVHIDVDEEEDEEDARCDLEISDRKVKVGEEVTIEWDVRDADEFTIEDDRGRTIHRDRSPSSRERGEEDVVITRDTEFTLEAEGKDGGDDDTCRVEVEVEEDDVLVLTERDQGKVAGISLTKVPYTGFEAGSMLTFLFYALLTIWGLAVAYFLVIRKRLPEGFRMPR